MRSPSTGRPGLWACRRSSVPPVGRGTSPSPSSSPACCVPPPSWRAAATFPIPAWGRTSPSAPAIPTPSTAPSIGCASARTPSKARWPAATWLPAASCSSTSPPRISPAGTARWPPAATPATGGAAPRGGGDEAAGALQGAAPPVAGVAAGGQRAVPAGEIRGGEVEEHESSRSQVAAGERAFDGVLARPQPIEGAVEGVGIAGADREVLPQAGIGKVAAALQLGGGTQHAGDDEGEGEVPLPTGGTEDLRQAQSPGLPVDGDRIPVGQGARDLEGFLGA